MPRLRLTLVSTAAVAVAVWIPAAEAAPPRSVVPQPGAAVAKTYVPCLDRHGDTIPRIKPRTCDFQVRALGADTQLASADEVYVVKMRWRGWGGKTARARGTFVGNMHYRRRGRIQLSGRRPCTGYGYMYTHFRMRLAGDRRTTFDFSFGRCA